MCVGSSVSSVFFHFSAILYGFSSGPTTFRNSVFLSSILRWERTWRARFLYRIGFSFTTDSGRVFINNGLLLSSCGCDPLSEGFLFHSVDMEESMHTRDGESRKNLGGPFVLARAARVRSAKRNCSGQDQRERTPHISIKCVCK